MFNLFSNVPQNTNAQNDLQEAINEKDGRLKLKKLEDYYYTYRRENLDKNVFIHLVYSAFQLRKYEKVIEFGERALRQDWNNELIKMNFYLKVASAYQQSGLNLAKASDYAGLVINLANRIEIKANKTDIDAHFVIPALFLQLEISKQQVPDPRMLKQALEKSWQAYQLQPSVKAETYIFYFAKQLYHHYHQREVAIDALARLCEHESIIPEYLNTLALWYSRSDQKNEAVASLQKSYLLHKDPRVAYSLGKMLQNRDIDLAIHYLAEAYVLNEPAIFSKVKGLLEHLYFNVKAVNKSLQEQESEYQNILNKARQRVKDHKKK